MKRKTHYALDNYCGLYDQITVFPNSTPEDVVEWCVEKYGEYKILITESPAEVYKWFFDSDGDDQNNIEEMRIVQPDGSYHMIMDDNLEPEQAGEYFADHKDCSKIECTDWYYLRYNN